MYVYCIFLLLQDMRQAVRAYQNVGTTEALQKAFIIQKEYDIDGAISTCLMDETGSLLPAALEMALNVNPPKSESFLSDLALKTSNYYLKLNKPGYALETAVFITVDERINFYKSNGFVTEFINLLQKTRRLEELYHFLKGCNKFEEGASIAKKFKDIDNQIIFELMAIKSKLLRSANHPVYSKEARQNDAKKLQLLSKNTHDHLQQLLLYYTALLEGKGDWYKIYMILDDHYLKIKAFDFYINMFKSNVSNHNVSTVFKNLRQLLHLYKSELDEKMIKFFDVSKIGKECYISPLMLQDLHGSDIEVYKKDGDHDGMFVLNESRLQGLFRNHTKSFAINWLKIIDEVLGYEEEQYTIFSGYVKVQDIINVMYYYTVAIEHKYYYDKFNIKCPAKRNSGISKKLISLLNFSWICYIPITHNSAKALIENRVVNSAFVNLGIKNSTVFIEKWVFLNYGNQRIVNFVKFAEETINSHISVIKPSKIRMIDLSPVIAKLEIITIGLLGILSEVDSEHKIVIPQSYEIATGFFNTTNDNHMFLLVADSEKEYGNILHLLNVIIKILLGDANFNSMLSMAFVLKYPDGCPLKQYQFERYFVLALALLGNLAPHLPNDVKILFLHSFKFLKTLKVEHQKDFIPMIKEAVKASTTNKILRIISKIQQLHFRKMVTFDFNNDRFKIVPPEKFQSLPLYYKEDDNAGDIIDKPMTTSHDSKHELVSEEEQTKPSAVTQETEHKELVSDLEEEQTKPSAVPQETEHIEFVSEEEQTKPSAVPQETEYKEFVSEEEQTKPAVPQELKLLPH